MPMTAHQFIGNHETSCGQRRRYFIAGQCESEAGHLHHYDHWINVKAGRIRVTYRETPDGPDVVLGEFGVMDDPPVVKAERYHTVKALVANTVYDCVFSHRDFDGNVSERYVGHPLEAEAKAAEVAPGAETFEYVVPPLRHPEPAGV